MTIETLKHDIIVLLLSYKLFLNFMHQYERGVTFTANFIQCNRKRLLRFWLRSKSYNLHTTTRLELMDDYLLVLPLYKFWCPESSEDSDRALTLFNYIYKVDLSHFSEPNSANIAAKEPHLLHFLIITD